MNVLVLLLLCLNCFEICLANDKWFSQQWLDENYLLKWNPNESEKTITFKVEVRTQGWVGFGLSRHGMTSNADMIIGWVDHHGKSFFYVSTI